MDDKKRQEIIDSFGKALEKIYPHTVGLDSDLPFPKNLIRLAIVEQFFFFETDPAIKDWLKAGLLLLDNFLPLEDLKVVKEMEAKFNFAAKIGNNNPSLQSDVMKKFINDNQQQPGKGGRWLDILKDIQEKGSRRLEQLKQLENVRSSEQIKQILEEIVKN